MTAAGPAGWPGRGDKGRCGRGLSLKGRRGRASGPAVLVLSARPAVGSAATRSAKRYWLNSQLALPHIRQHQRCVRGRTFSEFLADRWALLRASLPLSSFPCNACSGRMTKESLASSAALVLLQVFPSCLHEFSCLMFLMSFLKAKRSCVL